VKKVYIAPVGSVAAEVMDAIDAALAEWFPFPIEHLPALAIPDDAYDRAREQYQSVRLMQLLSAALPHDAARLVGVTEVDLAIPMLSFLFGQAQLHGPVAIISVARLRQQFYALPPDDDLLRRRVGKEVLHELGHTSGLTHCAEATCVMSLATHIALVDEKSESYCARCGTHLARRLASEASEPVIEEALL
jgi:archaemetzincin